MPIGFNYRFIKYFIKNSIKLSGYITSVLESPQHEKIDEVVFYNLRSKLTQILPYWAEYMSIVSQDQYDYVDENDIQMKNEHDISLEDLCITLALHIKMVTIMKYSSITPEYDGDCITRMIADGMLVYSENGDRINSTFSTKAQYEFQRHLKASKEALAQVLSNAIEYMQAKDLNNDGNVKSTSRYKECFGINIKYVKMAKWQLIQVARIASQRDKIEDARRLPTFMRDQRIDKFLYEFSEYVDRLGRSAIRWKRRRWENLDVKDEDEQLYCVCVDRKELERLVASKNVVDFIVLWFTGNWLSAQLKMNKGDVISFTDDFFLRNSHDGGDIEPMISELDPGTIKRLFASAATKTQTILEELIPGYKMPGIGTASVPITVKGHMRNDNVRVIEFMNEVVNQESRVVLEEDGLKEAIGQYGEYLWSKLENVAERANERCRLTPIDLVFIREWGIQQQQKKQQESATKSGRTAKLTTKTSKNNTANTSVPITKIANNTMMKKNKALRNVIIEHIALYILVLIVVTWPMHDMLVNDVAQILTGDVLSLARVVGGLFLSALGGSLIFHFDRSMWNAKYGVQFDNSSDNSERKKLGLRNTLPRLW